MAKENTNETRTTIDELNDSLSNVTRKVEDNKKVIVWAVAAVTVIVAVVLIYIYAVRQPGIQKANDNIGRADLELLQGNDSIALQQYMSVANNDGYDAANRAALQAAILLYEQGKYQEAIDYIKKFDASESVIGAGAYSLQGDCYVNMDKLDEALKCYEKAINKSDKNPAYTPFFMMKEARIYAEKKDFAKEAEIYQAIKDQYPVYAQQYGIDIDAYVERANAKAGK